MRYVVLREWTDPETGDPFTVGDRMSFPDSIALPELKKKLIKYFAVEEHIDVFPKEISIFSAIETKEGQHIIGPLIESFRVYKPANRV